MKLSRLVQEHRKFNGGLEGLFGDGYLLAKNRVYRQIREAALKAGYRFSSERDEAYDSFPLLQIDRLLATKILPYVQNLSAFRHLSETQLAALDWEDLDGNLKKNQVFHEACHAVVRELMQSHWQTPGPPTAAPRTLENERLQVLRMMTEEAAANTAELFGVLESDDPLHRIFYEMNSYNTMFEIRGNLKKAEEEFGSEPLMLFMLLAYVLSNVLRPGVSEPEFRKMLELTGMLGVDVRGQKLLRVLAKIAFQLSERFRVQTTAFHLRLKGIHTPAEKLFDFDVLGALDLESKAQKGPLVVMSAFVSLLI